MKLLFLLLIPFLIFGQTDWSDQTVNYPDSLDNTTSLFRAASGNVISSSDFNKVMRALYLMQEKMGVLSTDSLYSTAEVNSNIGDSLNITLAAKDTTTLKTMSFDSTGRTVYLEGLSSTNSNGSGWFVAVDTLTIDSVLGIHNSNKGTILDHPTSGKKWVRQDIYNDKINAYWYGLYEGSSSPAEAIQQTYDQANGLRKVAFLPALRSGAWQLEKTISLSSNTTLEGAGGNMKTRLQPTGDFPVIAVDSIDDAASATTRYWIKHLTLTGQQANTAPLIQLDNMPIGYFSDLLLRKSNHGVKISPDSGSTFIHFDNCQFINMDGYAIDIYGRADFSFSECDFEKNYDGDGSGSFIRIRGGDGGRFPEPRSLGQTRFINCRWEDSGMDIDASYIQVVGGYFTESYLKLRQHSSFCKIDAGNTSAGQTFLMDLGYNNQYNGIWTNTLSNGIEIKEYTNNIAVEDSVWYGAENDEFLFKSVVLPDTGVTGDTIFAKLTWLEETTNDTLYSSSQDTLLLDPADPERWQKFPKPVHVQYNLARVDSQGLGIKVHGATINKVKINLLTNGTFKDNGLNGWTAEDFTSNAAAPTTGYTRLIGEDTWHLTQTITTIPGHQYMIIAKTVASLQRAEGTGWINGKIALGPMAITQTSNLKQATCGSAQTEDGYWMNQIFFKAKDQTQQISIGSPVTDTIDVKWIACVDLTEDRVFSYQLPTDGDFSERTELYNLHPWDGQYNSWSCWSGGSPGMWYGLDSMTVADDKIDNWDTALKLLVDPSRQMGTAHTEWANPFVIDTTMPANRDTIYSYHNELTDTVNMAGTITNVAGDSGWVKHIAAFEFDGNEDYINFGDTLDTGYNDFILFAWVKNDTTSIRDIFKKRSGIDGWEWRINSSDGNQKFIFWDDGNSQLVTYGSSQLSVSDGDWAFIAVIVDFDAGLYFYKNKVAASITAFTTYTPDTTNNAENLTLSSSTYPFADFIGLAGIVIFDGVGGAASALPSTAIWQAKLDLWYDKTNRSYK